MQDNHRHFIRRDGDSGDNAIAGFTFNKNLDRKRQLGGVVINRYQNKLMNIDSRTIDSENTAQTYAINEHIREHNEQVEVEVKQYRRLQSFRER